MDSSFEELYRGHRADVFRAALRELGNVHDAEDVTQAAFVDAYRAVLGGSEPYAPRAWLLAIGENVRRRRFRAAQRRPREEPIDEDLPLAAERSRELALALAEALAELSPEQRNVFVLRELAGLSYDEIAADTQSTVGAVQMLLYRARKSLRELLEPPPVSRRRGGLLLPVPGWAAGLVSRIDVALVTPRAAGAVGAAVAAVAASVAATEAEAPGRVMAEPPAAVATVRSLAAAAPAAVSPPSRPTPSRSVPARGRVTPVTPTSGGSTPTASDAGGEAAAGAEPATASAASASGASTPEAPRLPGALSAEAVEAATDVVAAADEAVDAAPEPVVQALPAPPPAPSLPAEPIEEIAAGAAGAAGDGVPPLPVPVVPPVTLPPAP